MATSRQRGRSVPKRSPLSVFYGVLGLIIVLGIGLLIYSSLGTNQPNGPTTGGPGINVPNLDQFPSKGSADAPVTIVEFSDFQCPFCGVFATQIEPTIQQEYIDTGKVRFVYHDFPLTGIHANALPAAQAARCAADQDAFWPMHDLLFTRQNEWSNDPAPQARFGNYAAELGLDQTALTACIADNTHLATLQQAEAQAQQLGINATPTVLVNGQPVEFSSINAATDELRAAIDAALAQQGQ